MSDIFPLRQGGTVWKSGRRQWFFWTFPWVNLRHKCVIQQNETITSEKEEIEKGERKRMEKRDGEVITALGFFFSRVVVGDFPGLLPPAWDVPGDVSPAKLAYTVRASFVVAPPGPHHHHIMTPMCLPDASLRAFRDQRWVTAAS